MRFIFLRFLIFNLILFLNLSASDFIGKNENIDNNELYFRRIYFGFGSGYSNSISLNNIGNGVNLFGKSGISYQFKNDLYIALEGEFGSLFGNSSTTYSDSKYSDLFYNHDISTEERISSGINYAVIGKFGLVIDKKNIIYLLIGYDNSSLIYKKTTTDNYSDSFFSYSDSITSINKILLNGFRFGVGFEKILYAFDWLAFSMNGELFFKQNFCKKTSEIAVKNYQHLVARINLNFSFKI